MTNRFVPKRGDVAAILPVPPCELDIPALEDEGLDSGRVAFSMVLPFAGALVFGDDILEAQRILASHFDAATFSEPTLDGSFVRFPPRL